MISVGYQPYTTPKITTYLQTNIFFLDWPSGSQIT